MKADITRSTYRKEKKYVKVNAQQGKVQVDADYNEQIDIQKHLDKTFLRDIIGPTGTPIENPGFEIVADNGSYTIGRGRYYVDGILCENGEKTDAPVKANEQEDLPDFSNLKSQSPFNANSANPIKGDHLYLVYLDVWQRHITFLEDPDIREVALGGADTTTRTKTVWQAKTLLVKTEDKTKALDEFGKWTDKVLSSGTLQAQVTPKLNIDRCNPSPEAGYSGDENRLYRVEIHSGGAGSKSKFKWSRENAAVACKIVQVKDGADKNEKIIVVQNSGKDDRSRLGEGQWIEVTDDYHELWNIAGRIVQITSVEEDTLQNLSALKVKDNASSTDEPLLNFNPIKPSPKKEYYSPTNPKVRRWNTPDDKWSVFGYSTDTSNASNTSNGKPVNGASIANFADLEDGIQIKFDGGNYVPGDYWLIPARTVTGNLDWPVDIALDDEGNVLKITSKPLPSALEHHYCPLALIDYENGNLKVVYDYRDFFSSLTNQLSLYYVSGDGQEVKQDADKNVLPFNLVAGIAIGGVPLKVGKATFWKPRVQFEILAPGHGAFADGSKVFIADVDEDGLAACSWTLDSENILQQVKATLVDQKGDSFASKTLIFNGHLPISFYYMSGDGQEITPQNVFLLKEAEKAAPKEVSEAPPEKTLADNTLELKKESAYDKIVFLKDVRDRTPVGNQVVARRINPILLKVGAKMGDSPLESLPAGNFVVRFEIVDEDKNSVGSLSTVDGSFEAQIGRVELVEVTLENGTAECNWAFTTPSEPVTDDVCPAKQQVKATLRTKPTDPKASSLPLPTQLQPIYFNATFAQPSLHYACGDGQEVKQETNDNSLPSVLIVRVDAGDVPLPDYMTTLWNVKARFTIMPDQGTLDPTAKDAVIDRTLDIRNDRGITVCPWRLGAKPIHQGAIAGLVNSKGEYVGGPVFFNASLPISFVYVSGDGQEAPPGGLINLQVKAMLSSEPLVGYQVQFSADEKGGTLDPKEPVPTDENGLASCDWKITPFAEMKKGGAPKWIAQAVLLDAKGQPTNLPPIFFNAKIALEPKQAAPATSGVVKLELQPNTDKLGPLISNPIAHSLENLEIPPAIILSLLPPLNNDFKDTQVNEKTVDHFEDFCLYDWSATSSKSETSKDGGFPPFPRFKAVDVNTENFRILIEPPYPKMNWFWYIRWWALPAERKDLQTAIFEPAFFEPKIKILTKDKMEETQSLTLKTPFVVTVEDPNIEAKRVSVTLKLSEIGYSKPIVLYEKSSKVFMTTIVLNDNAMVVIGLDGKTTTYELTSKLTSDEVSVDYRYNLRQGFAAGTVSAKATLSGSSKPTMTVDVNNLVGIATEVNKIPGPINSNPATLNISDNPSTTYQPVP